MQFRLFLIVLIFIGIVGCTDKGILEHSIVKDEVYESPVKTQVTLNVLIQEKEPNSEAVKELLNHLYEKTKTRDGFKNHIYPTNIYIFAFASDKTTENGIGKKLGMLIKNFSDTIPTIDINN